MHNLLDLGILADMPRRPSTAVLVMIASLALLTLEHRAPFLALMVVGGTEWLCLLVLQGLQVAAGAGAAYLNQYVSIPA